MQNCSVIEGFTDDRIPTQVALGDLFGPPHQQVEGEARMAGLSNCTDLSQMPSLEWHYHEDVCI